LISSQGLNNNQQSTLGPINTGLSNGNSDSGFVALSTALINQGSGLASALDQLSPQKLQVWDRIAFDNFGFTASQVDNHLAGQRNGQSGFDTSGLQVLDPSMLPVLAQIQHSLLAWNPPAHSNTISDSSTPIANGKPAPLNENNRSSFFISGAAVLADIGHDDNVAHSDYTTTGVTAGADYRLDKSWTVGGLFSYGHTDATLDHDGSKSRVDSYSPGVYASYADHGWYANALAAYNYNSYNENRAIPFFGTTANGSTNGNQYDANLDGGYEFRHGDFTFGPTAALQYVHLDIDGFTENGAGAANLAINNQNADSLRSRLGGQFRYQAVLCNGKVTAAPHFGASWQHEYMDNSRSITSQFSEFGGGSFNVSTSSPERESALLDFGFDTRWNNSLDLFLGYQAQVGQSDFFAQSVQAGLKINF
ncbi:MAG: autotransporter outer membrane beta-barrel domain-containing protein, partial [Methylacidiphilales bacterium]|nr:autotransporter outer membrane beta-barrel domain-containing protein [Candidatus Methylacidiphilales bacterium]